MNVKEIKQARKTFKKALKNEEFRQNYRANISMCIYDNRRKDGRLNKNECNDVAKK